MKSRSSIRVKGSIYEHSVVKREGTDFFIGQMANPMQQDQPGLLQNVTGEDSTTPYRVHFWELPNPSHKYHFSPNLTEGAPWDTGKTHYGSLSSCFP